MTSFSIHDALREVLRDSGAQEGSADDVTFIGADPVYRTRYKVATAASASLAAVGVAMSDILELQTGQRPSVRVDARSATASLRSNRYVLVDGKRPAARSDLTGFYRASNDRWTYFHCNHAPHLQAVLKVLGTSEDKASVASAASKWDAFELEQAVNGEGGLGPAVRTASEWSALAHTACLSQEPLVDIRKIGESEPIPLPEGNPLPLSGLRVLDLTRVLAGPTCGRLLAESGADVLKVTCAEFPDLTAYQWDTGYGKRRTVLNIRERAGHERFRQLLQQCDVFTQAYRPGALPSLGFGEQDVVSIRPGIVCVNLNAFGYTGDWKQRRGFDTVVQAASGMAYENLEAKVPQFLPVSALDYIAGYLMNYGALVALKRRHIEGGSYSVNVSLARCERWLTTLGLLEKSVAETGVDELVHIHDFMVNVPTSMGLMTRLGPLIQYSDGRLNKLIAWPQASDSSATWI